MEEAQKLLASIRAKAEEARGLAGRAGDYDTHEMHEEDVRRAVEAMVLDFRELAELTGVDFEGVTAG